jgi:hypothetical protein
VLTIISGAGIDFFHPIEKENGIKYLYASLDKHPHVRVTVWLLANSVMSSYL